MTVTTGLPPVAGRNARILILGSLPGAESIRQQQYYAQRHNRFWWILGALLGAEPALPYEARLAILCQAGIALWDVCAAAERPGSLDSRIRPASVVPNAIGAFLSAHPRVGLICFNGRGAAQLFQRLVLPHLAPVQAAIRREILPSTSAAHAAMPPAQKLAQWRSALSVAENSPPCAGPPQADGHLAFP